MKKKLVELTWFDAEAPHPEEGWETHDPKEDENPHILKTYGLLVARGKNYTVYASTYDPETGKWSEKARIPSRMIKSIRVIEIVDV
jgi:hypothetical protein